MFHDLGLWYFNLKAKRIVVSYFPYTTINPRAEKSSFCYTALYSGNKSHSGGKKKEKSQLELFILSFFEKPCVIVRATCYQENPL